MNTDLTIEDIAILSVVSKPMTMNMAATLAMNVINTPQMCHTVLIYRINNLVKAGLLSKKLGQPYIELTNVGYKQALAACRMVGSLKDAIDR